MAAFAAWSCIRAGANSRRSKSTDIEITAGVGVKLKQIAYAGKAAGIGGFEWMEGIPGEVGGGLRMNAGAMGGRLSIKSCSVRFLDREGVAHEKTPAEMEVHYRHVPTLDENFAVSAVFRGEKATAEEITKRLDESQEKRRSTQPSARERRLHFQKSGRHVRRANWWMNLG